MIVDSILRLMMEKMLVNVVSYGKTCPWQGLEFASLDIGVGIEFLEVGCIKAGECVEQLCHRVQSK